MIKIFVNQLPFYFIHSTDINYVKKFQMMQPDLGVTFFYPKDYLWGWKENLYAVINKIFSILKFKYRIKYKYPKEYVGREFDSQKFDLVYSQGYLPKNIDHLPVFLETTFWIPGQNNPSSKEKVEEFENKTVPYMKEILVNKCLINLKSDCEINNAIKYFPQYKNRFISLPFLLPELKSLTKEDVVKKHENDKILKLLFVGAQSKRKGLPALLQAYRSLKDENPTLKVELHIVSGYTDGKVDIPQGYDIIEHGKLSSYETQKLFQQCHIFAMISQRESYGLVYIEAMANGCIVIARDYYPQKEIIENGKLGFLANPDDIFSIKTALEKACIMERADRIKMTEAALDKFDNCYSYRNVVFKYMKAFQKLFELKKQTI